MPSARIPLLVLAALAGGAAATAASAQVPGRLQDQRVEGRYRICLYQRPDEIRTARGARVLRVGRGEPCPSAYRPPREPAPEEIPAFATLRERSVRDGRTICIYRYLDRDYEQVRPGGSMCTYTPQLSPS